MTSQQEHLLHRNDRGNIYLVIVVVALVLIAITAGLVVFSGLFTQQRVEERAEKSALAAARLMNSADRVGQMNNMLVASRELLFDDRENYAEVINDYPDLQAIAKRFADQSREAAELMISEREQLAKLTRADLITFANRLAPTNAENGKYALPGVPYTGTDLPAISSFDVGYLYGSLSNVESPDGNADLMDFDLQEKYVDPASHLYLGNIAMTLPDPDSDLLFKIAPLAAPVSGTIAPARITSSSVFRSANKIVQNGKVLYGKFDQLPTGASLQLIINLKGPDGKLSQALGVGGTAMSNGGYPRP